MKLIYFKQKNNNGFTLIELSIVLVIIGIMLSVGVGLMTSLTKTSKISKERKQLQTIENNLIAYALSRGRLPEAVDRTPPTGIRRYLDYMAIDLSTANIDSWVQPYQYAVTEQLTETNSQNFCLNLYQFQNLYSWSGEPPNAPCGSDTAICVTSTDPDDLNADNTDNGRIASSGQGYYIAAYIFSSGEDRISSGKNRNTNFEYELASNRYDVDSRDDLVQELTFADLSAKICNVQNTVIEVEITGGEVWLGSSCTGSSFTDSTTVVRGQTLYFGADCTGITFEDLARCDATGTETDCIYDSSSTPFDGEVDVNAGTGEITQ